MARLERSNVRRRQARSSAACRGSKMRRLHPAAAPRPRAGRLVTDEAMAHIAELLGVTSAEVLGTATFYEMFKFEPVGKYCINVCTGISCHLTGAWELIDHAEHTLGRARPVARRPTGMFTLENAECIAACTEAPALQVNYRYRHTVTDARSRAARRRPARRSPRRRDPAARHAGPVRQRTPDNWAQHRRRHGRNGDVDAPTDDRCRRSTYLHAPGFGAGDRPAARHDPLRARRRAHATTATSRTGGYTALRQALTPMTPAAGARRGEDQRRCRVAAAPASRPARSGASCPPACSRATSSSTATRASRAPTRTAC